MLPALYTELAHLWPLLSPPEDYAPEAHLVRSLLHASLPDRLRDTPPRILELGAGGGHTLCYLTDDFDCTAVDLAPAMLECSRQLNPTARHIHADMRTLDLGETFDAVLCHDAIDYMTSEDDLRQVFRVARAHLEPRGCFLVAPTTTRERFTEGEASFDSREDDDRRLHYLSYLTDPDPRDTTCQLVLVILLHDLKTGQISTFDDRHTCGLFPEATWLRLLEEAGFNATLLRPTPEDFGLDDTEIAPPFQPFLAILRT